MGNNKNEHLVVLLSVVAEELWKISAEGWLSLPKSNIEPQVYISQINNLPSVTANVVDIKHGFTKVLENQSRLKSVCD